ncbi:hypothetical protein [Cellulomonas soli]
MRLGDQVDLGAGPVGSQAFGVGVQVERLAEHERAVLVDAVAQVHHAEQRQREVGAGHEGDRDGEREHVHEPGGQVVAAGLAEQVLVRGEVVGVGAHTPGDVPHVRQRRGGGACPAGDGQPPAGGEPARVGAAEARHAGQLDDDRCVTGRPGGQVEVGGH